MDLNQFIGRFHLILLHLPIGIIALAGILEFLTKKDKRTQLSEAITISLKLGMMSAFVAGACGWLLSANGDYDKAMVDLHFWSAIVLILLSIILFDLSRVKGESQKSRFYRPLFILTLIALTATGHFGASITHGKTFLLDAAPDGIRAIFGLAPVADELVNADMETATVHDFLIHPVLDKKCGSCHNPSKVKGELILIDQAGIEKGGKAGAVFVKGDPKESLLLQRVHLPESEKKHMPPDGKKQLSKEEIALITWWIGQGASFDQLVKLAQVPDSLMAYVEERKMKSQKVAAVNIAPISARTVASLDQAGISVISVAVNDPFVYVNLAHRKDLTKAQLSKLKKIKNNIVELDLAGSNVTDQMLSVVKSMKYLTRLDLSQTQITDKSLTNFEKLQFLRSLNLYGTKVTDASLDRLDELKRLERIYLWQTQTTVGGISELQKKFPDLEIQNGFEQDSIFGDVQMKPPVILADGEMFQDSILVELKLNYKDIDIYYTLDGTDPDSNSIVYDSAIVIKKTTPVKAIAQKEGWENSKVSEKQFLKAKYKPVSVKLDRQPNPKYTAGGQKSLFDFKKGTESFSDGKWLGWEGENVIAVFDLGKVDEVQTVTVGALEDVNSWIYFPRGIRIWTSEDGANFQEVSNSSFDEVTSAEPPNKNNYINTFPAVQARFIKVRVMGQLKNPKWHPGSGQPCWVFVDEILVE